MQCPQCGMNMGQAEECPHCGAVVVKHPAGRYYAKREPRRGLSLVATLVIFLAILGAAGLVFLKSDTYSIIKAKKHFKDGHYAKCVDILYDLMRRSGPSEDRLLLASDALRTQGEERMDDEKYILALPLFEEIIRINEGAMGAGGSEMSILLATYDQAICNFKLAQEEGKFVEPYGEYILTAESIIESSLVLAEELGNDVPFRLEADLHFLAAQIAGERAAAFWHRNEIAQARVFFEEAEEQLSVAIQIVGQKREFGELRQELDELRAKIY